MGKNPKIISSNDELERIVLEARGGKRFLVKSKPDSWLLDMKTVGEYCPQIRASLAEKGRIKVEQL